MIATFGDVPWVIYSPYIYPVMSSQPWGCLEQPLPLRGLPEVPFQVLPAVVTVARSLPWEKATWRPHVDHLWQPKLVHHAEDCIMHVYTDYVILSNIVVNLIFYIISACIAIQNLFLSSA
jgi:hypothetical protein